MGICFFPGVILPLEVVLLKYAEDASQACRDRRELRQVDVLVSQDQNIADAIRQIGVSR